jgi:hypothetical protein
VAIVTGRIDGVGHEDQRGGARLGHRGRPDDRLARPAGQDDDAGPPVPETLRRLALVRPHRPAVLAQRDRVCLAVHVPGQVLGGPAQLEQHLLEVAPLGGVDHDAVVGESGADQRLDLRAAQHLLQHRDIERPHHQPGTRVLDQLQPPVTGHRLRDVDQEGVRHRIAGVLEQDVDHLLGVMAGRPRVPEAERGEPVGVHVLGRALQLGERGDRPAAGHRVGVVHLEQQRLVALDDEGAVVHRASLTRIGPRR